MLAAVMTAPDALEPQEIPTPSAGPGEVLVRVGANTICGTDVRILKGEKTTGVELPVVLGHELAGHVAEVGAGVQGFAEGDAVAMDPGIPCMHCPECLRGMENICRNQRIVGYSIGGGMAEYMVVPAEGIEAGCLFKSNGEVPSEQLALAEPLGCCLSGQRWLGVEVDDVVLVMGAGPIGLFHLQLAQIAGARAVIVSEPEAGRRAQAERLGAAATVDPVGGDLAAVVEEVSGGIGTDAAIIAIGVPELVNEAVQLSRAGGRVSAFAGFKGTGAGELHANLIHYKQVRLTGSSNQRRVDFASAMRLIESGRIDTASMITHRFGIGDVHEALGLVGAGDAIKIAVMAEA